MSDDAHAADIEAYTKRINDMIALKHRERNAAREAFQRISGEIAGLQLARDLLQDPQTAPTTEDPWLDDGAAEA